MTLTLRCKLRMTAMTTMFVLAASGSLRGADEGDPEYVVLQTAELRVVVKDDENRPVAGAKVSPGWILSHEEEAVYRWLEDGDYGAFRAVMSDEDGVAVIRYPVLLWHKLGLLTTRFILPSVSRPEYLYSHERVDTTQEQFEAKLTPGGKVLFTAVDSHRTPVDEFGVILMASMPDVRWTTPTSGGRRSGEIVPGKWQVMLAKVQVDGPTLFSNVLPLHVTPNKKVIMRNILLTRGVTLSGKLSSNVPLPVAGHVIAVSMPQPQSFDNKWYGTEWPLIWRDWTEIRPDGTFEFESLPRGGVVQLIGICDGWVSITTAPPNLGGVGGQIFKVEGDHVTAKLAMERTATVQVQVVDQAGIPVTEGRISGRIDQDYLIGSPEELGTLRRSATEIRNQLLPESRQLPEYDSPNSGRFSRPLNENGIVTIPGIPVRGWNCFALTSERYRLNRGKGITESGDFVVIPDSSEPVRVIVTAVPKP